MKKIIKFSAGLLACALTCLPLFSCGDGSTGNAGNTNEFLTAEVGETYTLPYWIRESAEQVKIFDPTKKEVKETTWGYTLNTLGEYTVEYVVNGKKQSVILHVVDTTAPGFLPLNMNYTISPNFSLYVNAGEAVDLDDIFIAKDNSGKIARQYYEVYEDGAFKVTPDENNVFTPVLTDFYSVTAFVVDEAGNVGKISHRLTVLPTVEGVLMQNPDVELAFGPNAKREKTGYAGSIYIPTDYEVGTTVTLTMKVKMIFGEGSHNYSRLHLLGPDGYDKIIYGYRSATNIAVSEEWQEITYTAKVGSGSYVYHDYETVTGQGIAVTYISGCYGDFVLMKDITVTKAQ